MNSLKNKGGAYRFCSFLLLSLVTVSICFSASSFVFADSKVNAENSDDETRINEIKFEDHKWGEKFLNFIKTGPMILSRSDVFDVAPPPENSSQITKDELISLREWVLSKRNDDSIMRIHFENEAQNPQTFFAKEGLLNIGSYNTVALLSMIDVDHRYFILERKKHFSRPRPSQLDADLETVIPNPAHAAYPSGHASQTYMIALVLSEFDPENEAKYKQLAIDVAHRREIAGVHYPSDSVAGRTLAVDVLARLRAIPVFEKKFQEAKATHLKPSFVVMTNEEADALMTIKK